jgi:hypothetical protein
MDNDIIVHKKHQPGFELQLASDHHTKNIIIFIEGYQKRVIPLS